MFPSSKFWKFSESIMLIAWRHHVSHTEQRGAALWSALLWTSQLREGTHPDEAQHIQQEQPGESEHSSLGVSNTAPSQEQGILWNHSICFPVSGLDEERARCSLNSTWTTAKNTVAPLSVYTAIKAMAFYSTYPKPMKYLLIRKTLSIPGISLLSLLGHQKTIQALKKTCRERR